MQKIYIGLLLILFFSLNLYSTTTALHLKFGKGFPIINDSSDVTSFYNLLGIRPNNPATQNFLKIPFAFTMNAKSQLHISYSISNTWRPTVYLIDEKYGIKSQIIDEISKYTSVDYSRLLCEECEEFDVPDIAAFNNAKKYKLDGVIRRLNLSYSRAISIKDELSVNMCAFQLVGGSSPIDYLVSDAFIENFHKKITPSKPDPFGRQLKDFDQSNILFQQGDKEINLENNDFFFSTFDITYRRFFSVINHSKFKSSANCGLTTGIPLNKFNNYLSLAFFSTINNLVKISNSLNINISAGIGYNFNRILKFGESMNFTDNNTNYSYTFVLGLHSVKPNRIIDAGVEFLGESNLMNRNNYTVLYETTGEIGYYNALGGGNPWMFTTHNQYLSFYFSYTFPKKNITMGLKVIEDGNFSRSAAFIPKGSVAQDLCIETYFIIPIK